MKRNRLIPFLTGLLLLGGLAMLGAQSSDWQDPHQRITSLVQNKNYDRALAEVDKILELQPESVLARSWQVLIYLTREDSIQKAKLPENIYEFDPRYNFDLVLENVAFLETASPADSVEQELRNRALETYRQNFQDLVVALPNAPVTGYFRIKTALKFIPPFELFPVQEKRLEEINRHFRKNGYLYFDRFDSRKKEFFAVIPGFPILRQFEGEYDAVLGLTYDTLRFEFNNIFKDTLRIPYQKIDSLEYDLPEDYVQLYFEPEMQVSLPPREKPLLHKQLGNYQVVLLPVERENHLHLSRNEKGWQKWIIWGGVAGMATAFLVLVR